jgi:aspartate kinase
MLIVQKFGGTSVGSVERIRNVARRVLKSRQAGHRVVVIVSAMSGETDRLLGLARQVSTQPDRREVDVLVSTGEQVAVALLALAIKEEGGDALSFLGHQIHIHTDSAYSRARIHHIDASRLFEVIGQDRIPVVAGFQGIDDAGNITTLGRGGSDTSAVAVAASLKADVCEIFTDVDGVYTTDPNICAEARKIRRISYEEMLELASLGAKVLQIRSVEVASKYRVPVHVRSSFNEEEGTMVVSEEESMEKVLVTGVTLDRNDARITIRALPARPGIQAEVFRPLGQAGVVLDIIVQNPPQGGTTDLSFTLPRTDLDTALKVVREVAGRIGAGEVVSEERVAKVSIVGLGMRSHSGVAQRMFELLARDGIDIKMITTSEIRISCVVDPKYGELAVRSLHEGFQVGAEPAADH